MPHLELEIAADGWTQGGLDPEAMSTRVNEALEACLPDVPRGREVAVLLTGDAALADLNAEWRGKSGPTNVLSFPAPDLPGAPADAPLGDIALALETLMREAAAQVKPLPHHFAHLLTHGLLHLLGYDHETSAEAEVMEELETRILARLGIPCPYDGPVDLSAPAERTDR